MCYRKPGTEFKVYLYKCLLEIYFLKFTFKNIGTKCKKTIETLLESSKNLTTQQSDGIPYETYLQIGGEYFVTTNIDVQDGLFNGSTG